MQYISRLFETSLPACDPREKRALLRIVLEHLTGWNYTELILKKHEILSEELHEETERIIGRLQNGEPIQYILGQADFSGLSFYVDRHVLIPRPETEELVAWISENNASELSVLDIGTGSGCIPICLKRQHPDWHISALDISEEALATARRNAEKHQTDIDFFQYDILCEPTVHLPVWDIIVSNPPYVCESEKQDMEKHVLEHEPHTALFVPDDDPLRFYKAITTFAQKHLQPDGTLFFEINQAYGNEVEKLLEKENFPNVERRFDMYGNERMIRACRK